MKTYTKVRTFCVSMAIVCATGNLGWTYTGQAGDSSFYVTNSFESGPNGSGVFFGYDKRRDYSGAIAPTSGPLEFWTTKGGSWNKSMELTENGDLNVSGRVGQLSDSRLKTKITPLNGVLERLAKLQGVSYMWNEEGTALGFAAEQRDIGLLAQDVEALFPELVSSWEGSGYKTIDYAKFSSVLITAVNELRSEKDGQIATLEARLAALEHKVSRQRQTTATHSSLLSLSSLVVGGLVIGMVSRRRRNFSASDS